ncbi:alpha/beta hydrolase [Allosphingosinicella deserti]|uniref:alpha/beta hydrolase n=1 Tax=Allosphingosinicella deserti TaxID=2116704 RepID=UPI0018ED813F|nr:alpha/beta hydrolase [Sphingomonas deserti]
MALPASKKTRALLGYLAANDRKVRRERLCEMFWEVPDDPRGALRWSLSKLRGLIDDEGGCRLVADREEVGLDCSALSVDWRTLRDVAAGDIRKVDTPVLEAATAAWGDFLEGLELPRCDDYQAWLIAMREDARKRFVALLRELVQRPIDPERALALARLWTTLDPYDALARVALIDLLDRLGRRSEADQQRMLGTRKLDEADVPVPPSLRGAVAVSESAPPLPVQHVKFCTASDGTGLAYSIAGDGPPLVKTANWLNHLEQDWESPLWRHWIRELATYRQIVRYDERGNGLSDWNAAEISFEAFVDDLASVVDAAGLETFDLFAVSQGCSVSIAYAVRHPERVRRMVLYGGYAVGWKRRGTREEVERREAMMILTRQGWGKNNPAYRQMFTTLFLPDASPAEADWFNELQRVSTSPENAVRLQHAFGDIDVESLLPHVRVPTLVIHGRDDAVVPFAAGRRLAAGIPNAEFVLLESRNHLLLETEPAWPRAAACIKEFLAGP